MNKVTRLCDHNPGGEMSGLHYIGEGIYANSGGRHYELTEGSDDIKILKEIKDEHGEIVEDTPIKMSYNEAMGVADRRLSDSYAETSSGANGMRCSLAGALVAVRDIPSGIGDLMPVYKTRMAKRLAIAANKGDEKEVDAIRDEVSDYLKEHEIR